MRMQPAAIVLDILLWGEDAWGFLAELKDDGNTHEIPVLVVTTVDDQAKALALGADAYAVKPVERGWLVEHLRLLTGARPVKRVLVIDDDEVARYLLRQTFAGQPFLISEAQNGPDGVAQARRARPDVIFLDLVMPGMDGYHVMAELKADPATADIPVVVLTSKALDDADRKQLATQAVTVLSKATLPASGPIRDALSSAGVA